MKIYNTLTRKKEEFKPISEGVVKIYNCGPTVYNYFHIGNARNFIFFDCLRRYFEYRGFKVIFVQNITDIDDKIINKAKEENKTWKEIAEKYTDEYFKDIDSLGIKKADFNPKATEHIEDMIRLIEKLVSNNLAYEISDGVYFNVKNFHDYGRLSNQNITELFAGARVDINDEKKSSIDFALWKRSKEDEPAWDSPWGAGRPGWHIECSAMSMKYLSNNFDIHGGGIDLVFPHHENEIAQSEGATGVKVVNYWVHNGHLNIEGEKMSKSVGNTLLIRDILKKYKKEILRLFLISAHYRSPLDYTEKNINSFKESYSEIYNTYFRLIEIIKKETKEEGSKIELLNLIQAKKTEFIDAIDDDFNTAQALGSLFELINAVKQIIARRDIVLGKKAIQELKSAKDEIFSMCSILGIEPESCDLDEEVEKLIEERDSARKIKDWNKADSIKKLLLDKGIILEDTPSGTIAIKK